MKSNFTPEIDTAIEAMHNAGLTSRAIATITQTPDHSTICRRLKKLTPRKTTSIYKELRADVLAEKQRKILMDSHRVEHEKSARDQRDLAAAYAIYYDKERLERGQATENIGYMDYNRAFEQVQKQRQQLARELGIEESEYYASSL